VEQMSLVQLKAGTAEKRVVVLILEPILRTVPVTAAGCEAGSSVLEASLGAVCACGFALGTGQAEWVYSGDSSTLGRRRAGEDVKTLSTARFDADGAAAGGEAAAGIDAGPAGSAEDTGDTTAARTAAHGVGGGSVADGCSMDLAPEAGTHIDNHVAAASCSDSWDCWQEGRRASCWRWSVLPPTAGGTGSMQKQRPYLRGNGEGAATARTVCSDAGGA
jgi:hypothetical protein